MNHALTVWFGLEFTTIFEYVIGEITVLTVLYVIINRMSPVWSSFLELGPGLCLGSSPLAGGSEQELISRGFKGNLLKG